MAGRVGFADTGLERETGPSYYSLERDAKHARGMAGDEGREGVFFFVVIYFLFILFTYLPNPHPSQL